jgi:DNA-binding MltR family transcriptional regulator
MIEACNQFLRKYEIPAESKVRLRQVLSSLGVRESWVFPDLEHLAKEISDEDINF